MIWAKRRESAYLSFGVLWATRLRRSRAIGAVWGITATLVSQAARAETVPTEPSPAGETEVTKPSKSPPVQQDNRRATQALGSRAVESPDGVDIRYQHDLAKARKWKQIGLAIGGGSYLGLVTFLSTALLVPVVLGAEPDRENPKVSHLLPLYVPLVGPVWSLSYSDVNKSGAAWFWYGLLGVGQIAGTAMYAIGIAKTPSKPAHESVASSLTMVPFSDGRGQQGIAVMGRF